MNFHCWFLRQTKLPKTMSTLIRFCLRDLLTTNPRTRHQLDDRTVRGVLTSGVDRSDGLLHVLPRHPAAVPSLAVKGLKVTVNWCQRPVTPLLLPLKPLKPLRAIRAIRAIRALRRLRRPDGRVSGDMPGIRRHRTRQSTSICDTCLSSAHDLNLFTSQLAFVTIGGRKQ